VHCVGIGPLQGKAVQKYAEGFDLHLDYQYFDFVGTSFEFELAGLEYFAVLG